MVQIIYKICVEFLSHIFVFQRSNKNLWNLCDFVGFNWSQKPKFAIPILFGPGCLSVDRTSRPRQKSVDRSGRPTCTERARSLGWRPVDRVGWLPESFCYMEMAPVDRPVDRQRALLYVSSFRSTGRPVAQRSYGRSIGRAVLPFARLPTGRFL